MDQNELLSSTVELALDFLEKRGAFTPFAKVVSKSDEIFVYTAASDVSYSDELAYKNVLQAVKTDLLGRHLTGIALCFHSRVRLVNAMEKIQAVEVELHFKGLPSSVWYFPYKIDASKATVLEYFKNDAKQNLFAETR